MRDEEPFLAELKGFDDVLIGAFLLYGAWRSKRVCDEQFKTKNFCFTISRRFPSIRWRLRVWKRWSAGNTRSSASFHRWSLFRLPKTLA